jgi:hypothetical protein
VFGLVRGVSGCFHHNFNRLSLQATPELTAIANDSTEKDKLSSFSDLILGLRMELGEHAAAPDLVTLASTGQM